MVEGVVRRIFVHAGRAHLDDFLAVSVLLTKYPVTIQRVSEVPEMDNVIVVDVGNKYDGEKFFDHHQDKNLPASLILVLRDIFGIDVSDIPELQWISDWDTMGPIATQKKWGVNLPPFNTDLIGAALLDEFSEREEITPEDPLHTVMQLIGKRLLKFIEEQRRLLEIAKNAEVFEVKGLKVVKLNENCPITIVKRVHDTVAIVIQPNQRVKGALTLTRVDDHPRVDFRRISVPAHFVHQNGFMAVIDPENLDEALEQAIQD